MFYRRFSRAIEDVARRSGIFKGITLFKQRGDGRAEGRPVHMQKRKQRQVGVCAVFL